MEKHTQNAVKNFKTAPELHLATTSKAFQRRADWYVVQVRATTEIETANKLSETLTSERYAVFVPTKARALRNSLEFDVHGNIVFNGYVFIATLDEPEVFYSRVKPLIRFTADAIRLLAVENEYNRDKEYDESTIMPMEQSDKERMLTLMNEEYNIPPIEVSHTGEKIVLSERYTLSGCIGRILKIDKGDNSAYIEFEMLGQKFVDWYPMIDLEKAE